MLHFRTGPSHTVGDRQGNGHGWLRSSRVSRPGSRAAKPLAASQTGPAAVAYTEQPTPHLIHPPVSHNDRREDMDVSRDSEPASSSTLDLLAEARTYLPALIAEVMRLRALGRD